MSENSGGPIVIPITDQKEAPLNSQRFLLQIFSPKDELCKRKDKYDNKYKNITHAKLELWIPVGGCTSTF